MEDDEMPDNLLEFEKILRVCFRNKNLLLQALTHRSYINESHSWPVGHNERLEFLGDSVLDFVVTNYLFEKFPKESEGKLTKLRTALVNQKILTDTANCFDLHKFIFCSKGESQSIKNSQDRYNGNPITCDALEAVIGAIYLDQGMDVAKEFIHRILLSQFSKIIEQGFLGEYKEFFQEKAQGILRITPYYRIIKESGPDCNKRFLAGAYLGSELIANGEGRSKKEAEIMAAKNALEIKAWQNK